MTGDKGFFQRWSRLKQSDVPRADDETPDAIARQVEPPVNPVPAPEPSSPEQPKPVEAEDTVDLSKLPPIESLGRDADYSIFMRKGVPDDLRGKALRRLWTTNPELGAPDLFDMNALDYTGTDGPRPLMQPLLAAIVDTVQGAIQDATGRDGAVRGASLPSETGKPATLPESADEPKKAEPSPGETPPKRG